MSVSAIDQVSDDAGIYAVYDDTDTLRFIGITMKIASTVRMHMRDVPDMAKQIRYFKTENPTKETLQNLWKDWMQDAIEESGSVPDGNMKGNTKWLPKKGGKPELKVTGGKGLDDLNIPLKDILNKIVAEHKIVAFIKGTRMEPQCGFSYQMVTELTKLTTEFEVVNVLDEVYNPGVRDAVKEMSDWPTIPQLYVDGEFVGGSDIVLEMVANDELRSLVKP